jgi:hypothetical protein
VTDESARSALPAAGFGQALGLSGTTQSSLGASITQANVRTMQTNAGTANSDGPTFGYVMAPATAQILATCLCFTGASLALWGGRRIRWRGGRRACDELRAGSERDDPRRAGAGAPLEQCSDQLAVCLPQ